LLFAFARAIKVLSLLSFHIDQPPSIFPSLEVVIMLPLPSTDTPKILIGSTHQYLSDLQHPASSRAKIDYFFIWFACNLQFFVIFRRYENTSLPSIEEVLANTCGNSPLFLATGFKT